MFRAFRTNGSLRARLRSAVLLLQMLTLALIVQISGVAHMARDVIESVVDPAACHDSDCGHESDKCPPGCPNCHCPARANVAPPEPFDPVAMLALPVETQESVRAVKDGVHTSPWHASIYRPPCVAG